jgi:hypothetical protein
MIAEKTNATLSLRVITSPTMTDSSSSQMAEPCSKLGVEMIVLVGASAQDLERSSQQNIREDPAAGCRFVLEYLMPHHIRVAAAAKSALALS